MEPTKFLNMTPHDIVLYSESDAEYLPVTRKWVLRDDAVLPVLIIPKSGEIASVTYAPIAHSPINVDGAIVPLFQNRISAITEIEYSSDKYAIVSYQYSIGMQQYAAQLQQQPITVSNILTVKDTVFDSNGRPMGCLGFYRVI